MVATISSLRLLPAVTTLTVAMLDMTGETANLKVDSIVPWRRQLSPLIASIMSQPSWLLTVGAGARPL